MPVPVRENDDDTGADPLLLGDLIETESFEDPKDAENLQRIFDEADRRGDASTPWVVL